MDADALYFVIATVVTLALARLTTPLKDGWKRSFLWYTSAFCPFWIGPIGAQLIELGTGKFQGTAELWTVAWGYSHMYLLFPTVVAWILTEQIAGSIKRSDNSVKEKKI